MSAFHTTVSVCACETNGLRVHFRSYLWWASLCVCVCVCFLLPERDSDVWSWPEQTKFHLYRHREWITV